MNLKSILSECWTGYKQVGMKNKGGRQVPNCVPESVTESSKEDIIKDLDKAKNDLLKKVDVLIAKKKKLYSDVDIESPMSADEKKLDKDIADLFSDINKLVLQKRSLKEAQAVSGGKVHKLITGKNLKFKGKLYNQIDFETLGVDNKNGTIRLKIIAPKEIFGNEMSLDFRTVRRGPFFKTDTNNQLNEGLYHIGYNKGRGMGRGVFKDTYSSYKDAKKAVEKLEKERGGSYNMIAYYVADKDGNFVRESINEGRSIKSIQTDLDKVLNNIQSALAQYKAHKGTDSEKKHVENLKKLNVLKKKYEAELDSAVGGLYRDAELKIEEGIITEKQFKGLEGIPSTTSLEKISKDQKLKIIKAPGNIIDFIVPNGVNRNFWQVIGTGKIQKNLGGNYVLLGKVIHSPAFKSMDDLIDGVNWKSMEDRRRFNEGVNEAKELKWQDVEVGDVANVKAINKTGLIIKTYGRKFHLKFPNGSTKTYDADELTFIKN